MVASGTGIRRISDAPAVDERRMSTKLPSLSVVTAVSGRGDDSGRDYAARLTRLLRSLERAVRGWRSSRVEMVVVDWSVVPDEPPLRDTLRPPEGISLRVIEVPPEARQQVVQDSGRRFPEYAAKNVGVVRARSERVLVTNADVRIRSDLLRFCIRAPLGDHAFVRADRYDFQAASTPALNGLSEKERVFVAHTRHGADPRDPPSLPVQPGASARSWPRSRRIAGELGSSVVWGPRGGLPEHFIRGAHTNGAGDLLCVSKASWRSVGGGVEDPSIDMHADALLVAQLLGTKLRQVIYAKPGALLHEDHPRKADEERGGGGASWPAWLERILDIIDGRCSSRLNRGTFGLEDDELVEYTIV